MSRSVIRIIVFLSLAVMSIFMVNCNRSSPERIKMNRAAALMETRPDSSLVIMQSIDSKSLHGDEDKALYALLLTRVQDKNYITVTDDSLISIAVKYYDKTDDVYHKMLAQYYYGTVQLNKYEYPEGLVLMHKAFDYENQMNDRYWMGLISWAISKAYRANYFNKGELAYAKDEVRYTSESGRQPYIDYALLDLACAYSNNMKWDSALIISRQLIDSATRHSDLSLLIDAKRIIGISNYGKSDYEKFLKTFQEICTSGFSNSIDSANLSLAYAEHGDLRSASAILNCIRPDTSLENRIVHGMTRYKIFKGQNMVANALKEMEFVDSLTNVIMQRKISQNISNSVVNYLKTTREQAETEKKNSNKITQLVIILSILVFVIIVAIGLFIYRRQQEKTSKNIDAAMQLRKLLAEVQKDYTEVQKNYSKARDSIKSLLSDQYRILDELCRLLYESNNEVTAKRHISTKVVSHIQKLKDDPSLMADLESMVNSHNSNLMEQFRRDMQGLKESYFRLFLFSILGFSDSSISVFLDKQKTSLIWDMRRHLKDKIKKLETDRKSIYIEYLS